MTDKSRKQLKKWIFPIGIFILLFITETIIGSGAVLTYLYIDGKKGIERIEKYTVNYSMTLAEAFAGVAELSFKSKKYSSLKTLFHEKIEENTIDEAFFVLGDGKLIVHSNTAIEKSLMGNIANDEMAYNLDMILEPVTKKSRELFLSDYNIIDKEIPFTKEQLKYLQKYCYSGVTSSGWLFTKGVFVNGKPVGAVNFIISKERIFSQIKESIARGRFMLSAVIAAAFSVSLFISIIVMFRYHTIQKRAREFSASDFTEERHIELPPDIPELQTQPDGTLQDSDVYFIDDDFDIIPDEPINEKIFEEEAALPGTAAAKEEFLPDLMNHMDTRDDEYVTIELLGDIDEEGDKPELSIMDGSRVYIAPVMSMESLKKSRSREIKDAIPVHGRGGDVFH